MGPSRYLHLKLEELGVFTQKTKGAKTNQHLLSPYYVLSAVKGAEDSAKTKMSPVSVCMEMTY